MNDCLFCKIIAREIPSNIIFENDNVIIFPDIHPAADTHLLIVPREHISGIGEIGEERGKLLTEVYKVAQKLVDENNLSESSYRILVNGGKAQHIPHLHFHFLGGKWKKFV